MKVKRPLSLLLAFTLLLAVLASAALGAETKPPTAETYVSFGDSLTIGFEPGMTLDSVPYGFVDRLYEQALMRGRVKLTNYGIGGMTSTGLNKFIQAVADEKQVKASDLQPSFADPRADQVVSNTKQIKADIAAATLITITIGGNDIGKDILTEIDKMNDEQFAAFTANWMKSYTDNLTAALKNIFAINKNVRVYVADQYSPAPRLYKNYDKLQKLKDLFTATLGQIVQSFQKDGFKLNAVPVAASFVGSEGTYTHISQMDIHPNQDGYQIIAEQFAKTIWGEYRKDIKPLDPITVVVGGHTVNTPHLPALLQDSTFVPLREYSEALGATVSWDETTRTTTVRFKGNAVALDIGSTTISVNGVPQTITTLAPYSYESAGEAKTYVPLRLMAESLGFDVQYVPQSRTAYINP